MRLGVLSDTHNRLPGEVLDLFAGVDHIFHAGDIGSHDILTALEAVAPVTAVWGNTDGFGIRHRVPEVATVNLGGKRIVILHGHRHGTPSPGLLRPDHPLADIVIYGHTHRAAEDWIEGALYLNPGSAGAPRDGNAASIAILTIENDSISVAWPRLSRSD
jgi:putative phosphoesterase